MRSVKIIRSLTICLVAAYFAVLIWATVTYRQQGPLPGRVNWLLGLLLTTALASIAVLVIMTGRKQG
jgi:hypothetical protein